MSVKQSQLLADHNSNGADEICVGSSDHQTGDDVRFVDGPDGNAPPNPPLPAIESDTVGQAEQLRVISEPTEIIKVGAGGILIVPREDIGTEIDGGVELDLVDLQRQKIRKPGRREWIALNRNSELPTRLLLHKPKADGIEIEHFYVAPGLRTPIRDELKEVRVFVYYSFTTHTHALWIVNVTADNSWYESLQRLFGSPLCFFNQNAIRIVSDKSNARYRCFHKPLPSQVVWPTRPTDMLLGEALGEEHFISSPDHSLYQDLIDGEELR